MIYKSIPGWFDFEAFYDLMIQTLNKKEYSTFVEIGVWKGRIINSLYIMVITDVLNWETDLGISLKF